MQVSVDVYVGGCKMDLRAKFSKWMDHIWMLETSTNLDFSLDLKYSFLSQYHSDFVRTEPTHDMSLCFALTRFE